MARLLLFNYFYSTIHVSSFTHLPFSYGGVGKVTDRRHLTTRIVDCVKQVLFEVSRNATHTVNERHASR